MLKAHHDLLIRRWFLFFGDQRISLVDTWSWPDAQSMDADLKARGLKRDSKTNEVTIQEG